MDYLDGFIEQAKKNVERGYYDLPRSVEATYGLASLGTKLRNCDFSIIAEIKHSSPSGDYSIGEIDVGAAVANFIEAGAGAISVVVEPEILKGNISEVITAKKAAMGTPVLFKDFVVDQSQIEAAAAYGADCILLISSVVRRLKLDLNGLITVAGQVGLEVMLECNNAQEFREALSTRAGIIGINNRDLRVLEVRLDKTAEILEKHGKENRKNKPVVSESGVESIKHIEFLQRAGAKGALVGSALWKGPNPVAKVAELARASR